MTVQTLVEPLSRVRAGVLSMIPRARAATIDEYMRHAAPQHDLSDDVNHHRSLQLDDYLDSAEKVFWALKHHVPTLFGSLYIRHVDVDGSVLASGLVSHRALTTVGAERMAAFMAGSDPVSAATMKYHGIGTGNNAAAIGDTALQTELTTEYLVNNQRAVGTQDLGATDNVYQSNAVIGVDAAPAATIKEHGLFDNQTRGSGDLHDRTIFPAGPYTLLASQNLQVGYDFTIVAA